MARRATLKNMATKRRKSADVKVIKVTPKVWKEAMALAKGDAKRIEVVSPTEVIVR